MWFAEDARYPVLTDSRVSRVMLTDGGTADTVPLSMLAIHYPAAYVILFTASGIRITEPKEVTVGPVAQPYRMDIPAGWTGVLVLRVQAGKESYTRTIII